MTLSSHKGKAVVKTCFEGTYLNSWVDCFKIGDRENAIHVSLEQHANGVYIRMDHRSDEGALDVAMGKYEEGTKVVAYKCHKGGNQWFCVNEDGTISPTHAPNLCLGGFLSSDSIKLVPRFKPSGKGFVDKFRRKMWVDNRLIFDSIPPTLKVSKQDIMPLILYSHPGKAIVLKNVTKQFGTGMEEFL